MLPRFLIVGNPENRRITMFADALERRGHAAPEIVSHASLLSGQRLLSEIEGERLLRIDSFGENERVSRMLLDRGRERAEREGARLFANTSEPIRRGLITSPQQMHFGFLDYLEELREVIDERPWRVMNHPRAIAELFDKRITSRLYAARGIPVPEFIDPQTPDELLEEMRIRDWTSCFVKLACSSSASCLAVVYRRDDRLSLMTTIARRPQGWFNSLKIQRVDRQENVDEILGFLLNDGSQVERHVTKARLAGAYMDCRVLVVDEEPAFIVVRQSTHPITNLHLGGSRGDLRALREQVPSKVWDDAMNACVEVARIHRREHPCFYVGVDLMFEKRFEGFRVIEANAFGDLLPNLEREGLDVFEWEIEKFANVSVT